MKMKTNIIDIRQHRKYKGGKRMGTNGKLKLEPFTAFDLSEGQGNIKYLNLACRAFGALMETADLGKDLAMNGMRLNNTELD